MTTHEIVSSPGEFTKLEGDWNEVWQRARGAVFQSHSWISAWLQADPDAGKWRLHVALARRDGRIAAILPLAIRRYHGVRVLEFAAQRFSDYCDGIGPPDLLQALWSRVVEQGGFDVIRLRSVGPEAVTRPALASAALSFLTEDEDEISLRLRSVWPNGDAWLRTLNKKKKSNNARGRRMLSELGDVTVERFHQAMPAETILKLADLKTQWLRETKAESALLDGGPKLLIAFAQSLAKIDRLYAFVIRCGGEVVAGAINATHGKRVWAYFSAYDPRFQRVSPGILLMTEYTQRALDEGFAEIDYLRGNETYKFEFATTHAQLSRFTGAVTLPGRLALSAVRLQAALRKRRVGQAPEAAGEFDAIGSAYVTKNGASRIAPASEPPSKVPAFSDASA